MFQGLLWFVQVVSRFVQIWCLFFFHICFHIYSYLFFFEVDASSIQLVCCIEVGTSEAASLGTKRDVSILRHLGQVVSITAKIQPSFFHSMHWLGFATRSGWGRSFCTFVYMCFVSITLAQASAGLYSTSPPRRGAPDCSAMNLIQCVGLAEPRKSL